MPDSQRLLPPARVGCAYSEPWRVSKGGALVCDDAGARAPSVFLDGGDRAHYGGTLIAESISRTHAERVAECVNFCAGVEFGRGGAYVGGLVDVVNALERLFHQLREPQVPTLSAEERTYYARWSEIAELLRIFGRDPFRKPAQAQEGAA